jgi:hypothetical protein
MTQTLDKEKAVICRTQTKIRVSVAVDALSSPRSSGVGEKRFAADTEAIAQLHSPSTPRNLCELLS